MSQDLTVGFSYRDLTWVGLILEVRNGAILLNDHSVASVAEGVASHVSILLGKLLLVGQEQLGETISNDIDAYQ